MSATALEQAVGIPRTIHTDRNAIAMAMAIENRTTAAALKTPKSRTN